MSSWVRGTGIIINLYETSITFLIRECSIAGYDVLGVRSSDREFADSTIRRSPALVEALFGNPGMELFRKSSADWNTTKKMPAAAMKKVAVAASPYCELNGWAA